MHIRFDFTSLLLQLRLDRTSWACNRPYQSAHILACNVARKMEANASEGEGGGAGRLALYDVGKAVGRGGYSVVYKGVRKVKLASV
jgi:hypothetical protein